MKLLIDPYAVAGDPFWSDVVLLCNFESGGANQIVDSSSFGGVATIAGGASVGDGLGKFARGMESSVIAPDVGSGFGDSGSRFAPVNGVDWAIEMWFNASELPPTTPSSVLFDWMAPSNVPYFRLMTYASVGTIRLRMPGGADFLIGAAVSLDTWHFIQVTISSGVFYLDIDGVQVHTETMPPSNAGGVWSVRPGSSFNTSDFGAGFKIDDVRMTRAARPRGVVPSSAFKIG